MKSSYFRIEELVSKEVYDKFGETAWSFFDPRLIETLDFLKKALGHTITINNWVWGGHLSQRGLRENTCQIVKDHTAEGKMYLSGHALGMAVDFDMGELSAKDARTLIALLADHLPYKIRLEDGVTWVHLDVRDDNDEKVHIFKA